MSDHRWKRLLTMLVIRERLVLARKAAGLTQTDVARELGLTRASSFSPIERGPIPLGVDRFLTLCDLYGIDPVATITVTDADRETVCLRRGWKP